MKSDAAAPPVALPAVYQSLSQSGRPLDPGTRGLMLAHELTHVLQQGGPPAAIQREENAPEEEKKRQPMLRQRPLAQASSRRPNSRRRRPTSPCC